MGRHRFLAIPGARFQIRQTNAILGSALLFFRQAGPVDEGLRAAHNPFWWLEILSLEGEKRRREEERNRRQESKKIKGEEEKTR